MHVRATMLEKPLSGNFSCLIQDKSFLSRWQELIVSSWLIKDNSALYRRQASFKLWTSTGYWGLVYVGNILECERHILCSMWTKQSKTFWRRLHAGHLIGVYKNKEISAFHSLSEGSFFSWTLVQLTEVVHRNRHSLLSVWISEMCVFVWIIVGLA